MKNQATISERKCRKMREKYQLTAKEIVLRSFSHKMSKLKFFINKPNKDSQEVTFPIFSAGKLFSEHDELNFSNALKMCLKVSSRASLNLLQISEKFSPILVRLPASRPDLNSSSTRLDCKKKKLNFQMTIFEKRNSLTSIWHRSTKITGMKNYLRQTFSNTSLK